ncbi:MULTISPECIES: hypothetical protein [Calothrix]|uniref:Uncharacterized protein n=2 Tax=Calothrix TaxID=1186 RepID=A0ABR8AH62_9CYAN|nr:MULTISPECIES: hypothetical protein [Calothrix]MBD2198565.1 hypothetical protein [Calothrix parietina FACHB-288]MBD2226980.1 hypothetical protein [Calothrix anomala FACHB-343]
MNTSIWLVGTLATHRRQRILQNVIAAQLVENQLPSFGLCLMFGIDFQEAAESQEKDWYNWSQEPGRTLLLIPPFETKKSSIPCNWEIRRRSGVKPQQDSPLVKALAPEVDYELQGQLQIASEIGGAWEDMSINTAYYRKHPHSGIFAITCLPIWSLAVLDKEQELQKWLETLHSLAGQPVENQAVDQTSFQLKEEHVIVMLHLVSQKFVDAATALTALQSSTIFSLDRNTAQTCLGDLQSQGLVKGVQLTESGIDVIRQSPYLAYAEELEALAR